ncbi:MAG: hypothetical protein ACLP5H_28670 [Desulfomonilaceae bacterium]
MRIFIEFNHVFIEWPLGIASEMKARIPEACIGGIAWRRNGVLDRVAGHSNPQISPLDSLDELERKWLATPWDEKRLAEFEAMLGPGATKRIVTSDRNISGGFITGAISVRRSRLTDATLDHERLCRYIFGLLNYAFNRLTSFRPDLVMVGYVDSAISYTLGLFCHHLQIPFVQIIPARTGYRYVLDDSLDGSLAPVQRTFERALADPSSLAHQLPAARDYLGRFRAGLQPYEAFFDAYKDISIRKASSAADGARRLAVHIGKAVRFFTRGPRTSLRDLPKWDEIKLRVSVPVRTRWILRNGTFQAPGFLPPGPFAYYPLHVDPEASTSVSAPMFTNQLAVVEALVKSLPLGLFLLVKEHVPMLGERPAGFYARLKKLPGVILVSPFENSLSLINKAALTCVITGTTGWEAIQLGKPVIVFGKPHYLALNEGFVHCPDLSRLPQAVQRALDLKPVNEERLLLYIAAILDQSFDFPLKLREGVVTEETVRRHPEIVTAICDRLLTLDTSYLKGAMDFGISDMRNGVSHGLG